MFCFWQEFSVMNEKITTKFFKVIFHVTEFFFKKEFFFKNRLQDPDTTLAHFMIWISLFFYRINEEMLMYWEYGESNSGILKINKC